MAKEKPKYESQIKNLEANEYALYASSHAKENASYALTALQEFYSKRVTNFDTDPLFKQIFGECAMGINQGVEGIAHSGLRNAMIHFSNEYARAFGKTNVEEFMKYAEKKGYKEKLPDELKKLIEKYSNKTVEELAKAIKENKDEEAAKVLKAIETIKTYIFDGKINEAICRKSTGKNLEALVAEEEN